MSKYLSFFKLALLNSFEYRARGLIWLAWDTLPPIIMLFFWQAAFSSQKTIAGYTISSMFVYYILVMFIRTIVFTHPDEVLQREITSGKLASFYLTKPANILILKFLYESAYKVLRLIYLIPVIILFLIFYPATFQNLNFNTVNIIFFFLFIIFTFILFFLFKLSLGLTAFWFNETGWLTDLTNFLLLIFGGTLFPLEFLPKTLYQIGIFLPFRFEVFVPTKIFLGNIARIEFLQVFIIQILWIFLFFFLVRFLWRRGLKIYTSYGG